MRDTLEERLKELKQIRIRNTRLSAILLVLSLVVSVNVFWFLRQPGLTLAGDASCGILEHTHDEECFTQVCICDLAEETHIHSETCYTTQLIEAYENLQLVCNQTEDPHIHHDNCYTTQFTEATETLQLICTKATDPHLHVDNCYEMQLIDGQETPQLVCMQTEQPHTHLDNCYETITEAPIEETVLNCELQFEPHEHTENCYLSEVIETHEEQILTCGLSEIAHTHEDGCYTREIHCQLQEHVHTIGCYSDETADAETLLDWQNMFADYPYTGNLREDLVGIAKTQVGYCESTRNFEVGSNGVRRGYTRYGAWYGSPYRDWSAAFVSFCLNYAGADPQQTPGNIGANTMAELWDKLGRFTPTGEYMPAAGDLVFFSNNTVGIVTEVQHATVYVIHGDIDDAVCTDAIPLADASIAGWGITGDNPTENTEPSIEEPKQETVQPSSPKISMKELLDISNGPAFFIFAGSDTPLQMPQRTFKNSRTVTDLITYLKAHNGQISYTLLDYNDVELPTDGKGNYFVQAGTEYKLALIIYSDAFAPGTYQYQIPNGLMISSGSGTFEIEEQEVGTWDVTDNGLITINFDNRINNCSEITVSAAMGIQFQVQDGIIDFDGNITVTVTPPPEQNDPTKLIKSAQQGNAADNKGKTDPSKIYWTVEITGNTDSQIPGTIVTDKTESASWYGEHHYTASDMAAGLQFGATDPAGNWHSWTVSQDDPMLEWTESEWSYKIPETVICKDGELLELGNDNWVYYINYTTTPDPIGNAGSLDYANHVTVDNQTAYGWIEFAHGNASGEIYKTGDFLADASGGSFAWEITTIIPGIHENQIAYFWYISDYMYLFGSDGNRIKYVTNDADKATVTAVCNDTSMEVPHVQNATAEHRFAWYVSWSPEADGVFYGRNIELLCRCNCTEENCPWWSNGCGSKPWITTEDNITYQETTFCRCWSEKETTTVTLSYETEDFSLIEEFGGVGNQLRNRAELHYVPNGNEQASVSSGGKEANITIPGLFKKELTRPYENSIAHYTVTVNEAKLVLTDGTPLTINDVMTDTLAYVGGSLVITTEDANGNKAILRQDADYTVTYDGTGGKKDQNGKPVHVLDIVILNPQPVKYTLDYDTTLIIPPGTTQAIKYTNSATITLWGQTISSGSVEKTHTDINISAKTYKVKLFKTCASTGKPLGGAAFGLHNEQGGLITSDVTDESGELLFQTNVTEGIILREHVLYYLQELQAPAGYQLDGSKRWFCFCNNHADFCDTCTTVMAEKDAIRIPFEEIGVVAMTNEILYYDLPATGGPGIYPMVLVSLMFIMTPLVFGSVQRRKRKRMKPFSGECVPQNKSIHQKQIHFPNTQKKGRRP